MLPHGVLVIASLVSLIGQANTVIARADDPADGEREFVLQLQSRQFYNLAEQFCVRQSESCRTPDERAVWQMMLVDCRAEHAWNLQEPSRSQLLTHATESITQFIRGETLSAELDLMLRVRQIELLSMISRIDATRLAFGPKSTPHPLASQALKDGLHIAEAMREQIEQIRKSIESDVARAARDRTRCVVAELLLLQARQTPADEPLRKRAIDAAEQLMKSGSDNEIRFKARSLLAELSLAYRDFKGFDLHVISLTSMAETQTQQTAVAAFRIRGLLRREQPSEALQFSLDLEKREIRSEELSTLRLAALLNLFELLHKLDGAELRQKTSDEFYLVFRRLESATQGVWRECCTRIALRFSHVEKFGPEAATAIESVTELIAAGDLAAARRALLEMQRSFERSSPEIAATLSMQSGDLAIHLSDWPSAESDLTLAVDLFRNAGNREQQAASDLLRIYAMGRHWDTEISSDVGVGDPLEAAYRIALERHISEYSDLNTSVKAREWHAMLLRATDPVAAASELLKLADRSLEDKPMLLIQSGEILIEVLFSVLPDEKPIDPARLSSAITEWTQHANELAARASAAETSADADAWLSPVLEIQRLVFSLNRRWSAQDNWQQLAADTTQHLDAIAALSESDAKHEKSVGFSGEQQTQIDAAKANGYAILALAACRLLSGGDAIEESRRHLMKQTQERRRQVVGFLLNQTNATDDPIPGDPQLGFLALDLLRIEKSMPITIDRRLALLPVLLAASDAADNFQQCDEMIDDLTTTTLTDVQLRTTASILQRRSSMKTSAGAPTESVRRFWRSVLDRSRSGEDQWLEASLQLATIAVQDNNFQEGKKVLNVIDALHPEWGTPERLQRATILKARLESAN